MRSCSPLTSHRDAADDDTWTPTETVLDGPGAADDHVHLTSDGRGRLYAAAKTSVESLPGRNPKDAQVLLLVRGRAGGWRSHVFGYVEDKHTRPRVLIDAQRDVAYVLATAPGGGGAIYCKHSPLDRISFQTGSGTAVVSGNSDSRISNMTSTKQTLTNASGLVVLASDDSTGFYAHALMPLAATATACSP